VNLSIGSRIGPYEVIGVLGTGGMGEVYRARDPKLQRDVAIKILRTAAGAGTLERFDREARALASLNHPNIAHVHGFEESGDVRALVMELVDGPTVADLLTSGALPIDTALSFARQIADAIEAAHDKGIVHRDLKPANIKITGDRTVKVLDFGLAKVASEETPIDFSQTPTMAGATMAGAVLGTAPYMSPEQARGKAVDEQADIWSFGCVLYELLSGRRAFDGETSSDAIAAVLTRDPDWTALPSVTPPGIRRLLERCLQKDSTRRLHDIADARVEIDDARASLPALRESQGRSRARVAAWIAAGAGAAIAAWGMGVLGSYVRSNAALSPVDSIAVLPFTNQNHDQDTEYLSDGLAESIINNLSQIASLRVIARASAFRYKGADVDQLAAGKQLGVRAVVVGRVLQRGNNLVVSAELVDLRDNKQIWGQQYNRQVSDIFTIQEEMAKEISEKLRVTLNAAGRQQLARRPTDNLKAFQYYMQGRTALQRRTREDLLTAIGFFEQAIAEDGNYALAYTGVAEANLVLGARGFIAPRDGRERAEAAAQRALALDSNLAEAHLAVAQPKAMFAPYDLATAERELHRATEISPGLAMGYNYLGLVYARQARYDESIKAYRKSRELDPLSLINARASALPPMLSRNYGAAWDALAATRDLGPSLIIPAEIDVYVMSRKFDEARHDLDAARQQRKDDLTLVYSAGILAAAQGNRAEALRDVAELEALSGATLNQAHWIAKIYSMLGERDRAFSWLERGLSVRAIGDFFKDEPVWDPIRNDPRFAALLREMNVPN